MSSNGEPKKYPKDNPRIFKDEDGQEYIGVADFAESSIIIAPVVKAEPKWSIRMETPSLDIHWLTLDLHVPEDQAQLIKQSVEVLMDIIMADEPSSNIDHFIRKARQALQEDPLDASGRGDVIPKGI